MSCRKWSFRATKCVIYQFSYYNCQLQASVADWLVIQHMPAHIYCHPQSKRMTNLGDAHTNSGM